MCPMNEMTAADIRNLPLPDLALKVLAQWGGFRNINNLLRWMEQSGFSSETDLDLLMMRTADAWSWLEAHALLADDHTNTTGRWQRISELGAALVNDPAESRKSGRPTGSAAISILRSVQPGPTSHSATTRPLRSLR